MVAAARISATDGAKFGRFEERSVSAHGYPVRSVLIGNGLPGVSLAPNLYRDMHRSRALLRDA